MADMVTQESSESPDDSVSDGGLPSYLSNDYREMVAAGREACSQITKLMEEKVVK